MFEVLVLQQLHGLSDFELEKQCIDWISFKEFLGFPEYSTKQYYSMIIQEKNYW